MTTIDHLLKLRQARQDAEDTLKARYSFEARIAYDNAARAFEYALSVAAEDLLKMVEAGQSHTAGLLEALEAIVAQSRVGDGSKPVTFSGRVNYPAPLLYAARAAIAAAKGGRDAG